MSDKLLPAGITLTAVAEQDFPVLRELAGTIWRQHYAAIISAAQIEYMLAGRLSDEALQTHIQVANKWLELLRVSGTPVGYCGYELASMQGDETKLAVMKLGQLYVLESHRGLGLGKLMLGHVEEQARKLGCSVLWLQVNKKNAGAIGFYMATGFEVVREAVFDIGGGFVMDDYLVEKQV
jgi:GNAT superfamily N-acetyltransferase